MNISKYIVNSVYKSFINANDWSNKKSAKVAYLLEKISRERSLHNLKLKNGYITGFEEISFMLNRSRIKTLYKGYLLDKFLQKNINKRGYLIMITVHMRYSLFYSHYMTLFIYKDIIFDFTLWRTSVSKYYKYKI